MRNNFSVLTLISISVVALNTQAAKSKSMEPENLITSCAAKLTAASPIQYTDEFGVQSSVTLGEIVMHQMNRYQVLVQKKAPVVDPSTLEITVSNDSPFIHDFEAPIDYFPAAKIYGIDWKTTKEAYAQSVLKITAHNPKTGSVYYFNMQSGKIPLVPKETPPTSPVDVRYLAAKGAQCSPWFDQNKNGTFYDMQTQPVR